MKSRIIIFGLQQKFLMSSVEPVSARSILGENTLIGNTNAIKNLPILQKEVKTQGQRSLVQIQKAQTQKEVKFYEWRAKTEFPIIKITHFSIKRQNSQNTYFQVQLQEYPFKLNDLKDLPLFKILYLLKESLIGFERLFHKFGSFLITSKMIALNKANRCKVWINENYASNRCRVSQMSEQLFLLTVCQMFRTRGNKLKNTQIFFQELSAYTTFCSALAYIQNYAKTKKIAIQLSCKITEKELENAAQKMSFNATLTMNKAHKRLSSNLVRISLKPESLHPFYETLKSFSIKEHIDEQTEDSIKTDKSQKSSSEHLEKKPKRLAFEDQLFFKDILEKTNETLVRSHYEPKIRDKQNFRRKLSEQCPQITYLSPMKVHVGSRLKAASIFGRQKCSENCFTGGDDEQKSATDTKISQTKWENGFNSLFDDSQTLKKSIHSGKQYHRRQSYGGKLELLCKFGKAIQQSFIKEEAEVSQY